MIYTVVWMRRGDKTMRKLSIPQIRSVQLRSGFWRRVVDLVQKEVIPYQWEILNDRVEGAAPSHCIENFRIAAGEHAGEYYGMVFQDSDLAKWLEAVAYSLMLNPDPKLEALADEAIELVGRAQQPDGYLNTYYTVKEPGKRWTNLRDCHELYCAGHMMEAAAAYFEATGKRQLLDIMIRMAHHIQSVIGPEDGKLHGYPGHQEIELALVRMYEVTKDEDMLQLAQYFLDERGKQPNFFHEEYERRGDEGLFGLHRLEDDYAQHHLPVREQTALTGHSVRAIYMATGMADVARETGDESLLSACRKLFDNLDQRRTYITGGYGSTHVGEAFTFDFDLPNDTVYAETCASIALCFFARALLQVEPDGKYADAMERALYNTCLAGMALDGKTFFYVNPLEVWPEASHNSPDKLHVLPVRPQWFGCACCPPNLARMVTSLGKYIYGVDGDTVYMHLYMDGQAHLETNAGEVLLDVSTEYPYEGEIRIHPSAGQYALALRIPKFSAKDFAITLNGKTVEYELNAGYAIIHRVWSLGDELILSLNMAVRRVYANPKVRENIGKVALMRGPLVYCLEGKDNGDNLCGVYLPRESVITEVERPDKLCGIVELEASGCRVVLDDKTELYREVPAELENCLLHFIPYYTWANRGENEMVVWVRET